MNKQKRILLVDDEPDILEILQFNLEKQGYEIVTASNGKDAVELAIKFNPHIILMDIMMPIMDGIEACRQIRENPQLKNVFIIFLTARSEEYSEVAAFEAGANDYVIKPFKIRALIGRITAYFERVTSEKSKTISNINIKNLSIDKETFTVIKESEKITLARKEFELLYLFCQNPNKVFTRESLLKEIWGTDVYLGSRTVDVHIRKIREKIGMEIISTVKGVGYKLEVD